MQFLIENNSSTMEKTYITSLEEASKTSVSEAPSAAFDPCWRGEEAAEAGDTLNMNSNQVDLSGKLYNF